jgi:hypothetical protein
LIEKLKECEKMNQNMNQKNTAIETVKSLSKKNGLCFWIKYPVTFVFWAASLVWGLDRLQLVSQNIPKHLETY